MAWQAGFNRCPDYVSQPYQMLPAAAMAAYSSTSCGVCPVAGMNSRITQSIGSRR